MEEEASPVQVESLLNSLHGGLAKQFKTKHLQSLAGKYCTIDTIKAATLGELQDAGLPLAKAQLIVNSCRPGKEHMSEEGEFGAYPAVFKPEAGSDPVTLHLETSQTGLDLYTLKTASGRAVKEGDLDLFYVDENGYKQKLQKWLDLLATERNGNGLCGCTPLIINGLVKAGKTHVLTHVLAAVIAEDSSFGANSLEPAVCCCLNFEATCRTGCYASNLQSLIQSVLLWAGGSEARILSLANKTISELEHLLKRILLLLPRFTFFLVDEVQDFYNVEPENIGRSRSALKTFVQQAGPKAAFAFTGSNLASFWWNVARTRTNGYPLHLHSSKISLPSSSTKAALEASWERWMKAFPNLPIQIPELTPQLVSIQSHVCESWLGTPSEDCASTGQIQNFIQFYEATRLQAEVKADLLPVLKLLSKQQRVGVYQLIEGEGADTADLDLGIKMHFGPYLKENSNASELLQLDAPCHKHAIKSLVDTRETFWWQRYP